MNNRITLQKIVQLVTKFLVNPTVQDKIKDERVRIDDWAFTSTDLVNLLENLDLAMSTNLSKFMAEGLPSLDQFQLLIDEIVNDAGAHPKAGPAVARLNHHIEVLYKMRHDELVTKSVEAILALHELETKPTVKELSPFPPNCNPYQHDNLRSGQGLVKPWEIMFEYGELNDKRTFIFVNTKSGRRFEVDFSHVQE